jgi:hypothetical protein
MAEWYCCLTSIMFVTQSFNHVLPPCISIVLHYRIHFQTENLLEKGSKFEEDKNTKSWWWRWSVSTAPQISWERIHFHYTIYYRIHFHARNLLLKGSKFKEEKGYHELMMVVLTCCPTVL